MNNPYIDWRYGPNYNTSGGYMTTTGYNTSTITVGYQPLAVAPPPREKTALEWLREQVAETCAEAKVAA